MAQDASAEFDDAIGKPGRTWVPPRLRTDWDGSGYGGDGSIDNLTPQMGQRWSVSHKLDDGFPASVTFVSGVGVPDMAVDVGGRTVAGTTYTAVAYWSPLRTDSPVHGFARDVAPVTLDVGLVTSAGPEYVRLYTGQMVNTPVAGTSATLQTISASRLALMKHVQPPAFSAYHRGLTGTWPISWILRQCGLNTSPPARDGCVWHVPMHGSATAFIPGDNSTQIEGDWRTLDFYADGSSEFIPAGPDWIEGPYLLAPDLQLLTAKSRRLYMGTIRLGDAGDILSQAGNKARLEFWVRGDATDYATAPGGSGSVSRIAGFRAAQNLPGAAYVFMGINTSRQVFVTVFDGSSTRTLTSSDTLPTDGQWYHVGAAYDITENRLWVRNFAGTTQASTELMTAGGLFANDSFASQSPDFVSYVPIAEIHLTAGAEANVDDFPDWLGDVAWTQSVRMTPSTLSLVAMAETEPREAWEMLAKYAQAELASLRITEIDEVEYLGVGWWVKDDQQVVTETLSTGVNVGPFAVDQDPSKIRNAVTVSYTDTVADVYESSAHQVATSANMQIPPGTSRLRFALSQPIVATDVIISTFTGADLAIYGADVVGQSYMTVNTDPEGGGEYATTSEVIADVVEWDAGSITVEFQNFTLLTWYLANDQTSAPALNLLGRKVYGASSSVTDVDDASVAERGERALTVPAPVVQSRLDARRLARNVKMSLRNPVTTLGTDSTGLPVIGNPLRQPGDLVTVEDTETGASGSLWRIQQVDHAGDRASYTNAVVVRQVQPLGVWGDSVWGGCLWQEYGSNA